MKQKFRLVLLLLLILVIVAGLTTIFYYGQIIKYQEYSTNVYVVAPGSGAFGIDKEDNLRFGKIAPGNEGERVFNITTGQQVFVKIKTEGNISSFLESSDNNFLVEPGQTKEVKITAKIPPETPLGFYSGKIKVVIFKPLFR